MRPSTAAGAALFLAFSASAMPPDEARLWREDLRFMAREMERTHRNLFHAVPRSEFAEMVAALDTTIPSLARHEVIVEMARIVAAVGDGHTDIYPTRDPKVGFHTLPVAFTFFGDEPRRGGGGPAPVRAGGDHDGRHGYDLRSARGMDRPS